MLINLFCSKSIKKLFINDLFYSIDDKEELKSIFNNVMNKKSSNKLSTSENSSDLLISSIEELSFKEKIFDSSILSNILMLSSTLKVLSLYHLDMDGNIFVNAFNKLISLSSLKMSRCKLTSKNFNILSTSFSKMKELKILDLSDNMLNCSCMKNLVENLLVNKSLRVLDVSENYIYDKGLEEIKKIFSFIEELNLAINCIKDDGIISIANGIMDKSTVIKLDITQSDITLLGLKKLFNSIVSNSSNSLKTFIYERHGYTSGGDRNAPEDNFILNIINIIHSKPLFFSITHLELIGFYCSNESLFDFLFLPNIITLSLKYESNTYKKKSSCKEIQHQIINSIENFKLSTSLKKLKLRDFELDDSILAIFVNSIDNNINIQYDLEEIFLSVS